MRENNKDKIDNEAFELTNFIIDYWSKICEINIYAQTNNFLKVNLSLNTKDSISLYKQGNYLNIFSLRIPKEVRGKEHFKNFMISLEHECKCLHFRGIKILSVFNPNLKKGLIANGYKAFKDNSHIGVCCVKEF